MMVLMSSFSVLKINFSTVFQIEINILFMSGITFMDQSYVEICIQWNFAILLLCLQACVCCFPFCASAYSWEHCKLFNWYRHFIFSWYKFAGIKKTCILLTKFWRLWNLLLVLVHLQCPSCIYSEWRKLYGTNSYPLIEIFTYVSSNSLFYDTENILELKLQQPSTRTTSKSWI
jgi:hypothetical protein